MPLRTLTALALTAVVALVLATSASAATPKRIVALSPFTANALATLGVTPIARGNMPGENQSVYQVKVRNIRKLTLSHPNGPNMEQLAVLNPDLILSSAQWHKGKAIMEQLGMKVVETDPQSVNAVWPATKRIGALIGKAAQAKTKADDQRRFFLAAKNRAKGKRAPRVLLILGVGRTPYAFLPNSWGGDVIKQAGGELLTRGLTGSGGFARISNEDVVNRDPDVIIAVPHGETDPRDRADLVTFLRTNPAWRTTKAAINKRVYVAADNELLQASPLVATVINHTQNKYLFPTR